MAPRHEFSPLCDVHHTPMRRLMVEEDSAVVQSYHACERRDCTRVFRETDGYTDRVEGRFDDARASVRRCPRCNASLFLAQVDHGRKVEIWECPQPECDFTDEAKSPSAR